MKIVVLVLVLLILGAAGYSYYKDPAGCQKLGADVVADTTAIAGTIKPPYLTPTPVVVVPATPPPITTAAAPPPVTYAPGYVATPTAPAPAPATGTNSAPAQ